jgi:hypothetical protein
MYLARPRIPYKTWYAMPYFSLIEQALEYLGMPLQNVLFFLMCGIPSWYARHIYQVHAR